MKKIFLKPEEIFVCNEASQITTLLGSCVAVCLYDSKLKIGGICHYMLPSLNSGDSNIKNKNSDGKFATTAILQIIKKMKNLGCSRENIEAKILGGGSQHKDIENKNFSVGDDNIKAAFKILKNFGIPIKAKSIGGNFSWKLRFHTSSGLIEFKKSPHNLSPPQTKKENSQNSFIEEEKKHENTSSTQAIQNLKTTKVYIIDDSPSFKKILQKILEDDPSIQVVGSALNPIDAMKELENLNPDVISLDLHMPIMNGVEFLKKYKIQKKIPVVLVSSLSKNEGGEVLKALELGAIDFIQKPRGRDIFSLKASIQEVIKTASQARKISFDYSKTGKISNFTSDLKRSLILIGASTGGTVALETLLKLLPDKIPPILIVQHIPKEFSGPFAQRLNRNLPFNVKEAIHGDAVLPNQVLIAPGHSHMELEMDGYDLKVTLNKKEPINRHRPSVDALFDSVKKGLSKKRKIIGIILTGMGADGAKGLLKLKAMGANTIAQDEKSSTVFGMPKVAIELGAAEIISSLTDIPKNLKKYL